MKRHLLLLSLAAALGLPAPSRASADCGGPGCALATVTGIGGVALTGFLLVPVSVESYYLTRNLRPPEAAPILSFVLITMLLVPTSLMWVAADRTGEPGFWAAGAALTAAAGGGLLLGIVSLTKTHRCARRGRSASAGL